MISSHDRPLIPLELILFSETHIFSRRKLEMERKVASVSTTTMATPKKGNATTATYIWNFFIFTDFCPLFLQKHDDNLMILLSMKSPRRAV
jgi:hypothetical protein